MERRGLRSLPREDTAKSFNFEGLSFLPFTKMIKLQMAIDLVEVVSLVIFYFIIRYNIQSLLPWLLEFIPDTSDRGSNHVRKIITQIKQHQSFAYKKVTFGFNIIKALLLSVSLIDFFLPPIDP